MRTSLRSLMVLLAMLWAMPAFAENVSVETVLTDLSQPRSVAIRPGGAPKGYEVFVAESAARRVIKISSDEPNRRADVITGFPAAEKAAELAAAGNPFCLLFLDEKHLAVGVAGEPPEVRLYELTDAAAPLGADSANQRVTPDLPIEKSRAHFGKCIGLARTRANDYVADMLMVAVSGDDEIRGIWTVPVRANMLGAMTRLQTKPAAQDLQSTSLTVSEQGYVLAADAASRSGKQGLVFLNPTNGELVLEFRPDLREIRGVAYSPKSGNLYALATANNKDEQGLFRIDDDSKPGEPKIKLTKVIDIAQPTSLAFAPDGALYVTRLVDNEMKGEGALLKVTGEL